MEDVFLLIKWSEFGDLPGGPVVESVPAKAGTQVQSLVRELRSRILPMKEMQEQLEQGGDRIASAF